MKPGQISPALQEGNTYHIIKLEKRIHAGKIKFNNANRKKLRRQLTERLISQRQLDLESELFQNAKIDIRNKTLNRQFRQKYPPTNK
jgi:parvulin-like peptidyl-prolyl isomerase